MQKKVFQFNIGNFKCASILDTIDPLDYDFIFPDVPASSVLKLLEQLKLPTTCMFQITSLFIKTPKHNVLIDTGIGIGAGAGDGQNRGMLINNLKELSLSAEDIDTVILSHGHLDHVGGNVNSSNKPNFPKARYFVNRKEWEWWESKPDLKPMSDIMRDEILAAVNKNLLSLRGKINLIDSGIDIIPGIQYLDTPGHTIGHSSVLISSGAEQLFYTGDMFHNLLQLARPDWYVRFDHFPQRACEARIKALDRILSTNTKVFACHFPFPCVGKIIKQDSVFSWQPLDEAKVI
jgi:glyoxylase-like metal-dependent hydrolase (beta-lactamase superfamily II)